MYGFSACRHCIVGCDDRGHFHTTRLGDARDTSNYVSNRFLDAFCIMYGQCSNNEAGLNSILETVLEVVWKLNQVLSSENDPKNITEQKGTYSACPNLAQ